MLDTEWMRLADYLQNEWQEMLTYLVSLVTPPEEDCEVAQNAPADTDANGNTAAVDVKQLRAAAQKWLTDTANSIENVDSSILDNVIIPAFEINID